MSCKTQSYANAAQTIIKNLEKRNMKGFYCETAREALELVESILPEQAVVTHGGSETLVETGIIDLLRSPKYQYIDRASAKTPEEARALYGQMVTADYFFTGTNAITINGELVNIDGNGNRVACLIHGPAHVIVVVGMNKVTANVEDAIRRVRNIAAPPNGVRLNTKTPCAVTGVCGDCHSPNCMCCQTVITRHSRHTGRIQVILVGESLGF